MKGYPIEIMDEPLFFDAIKRIIKPERGFPLERNRNFKPPGNAKFVHEHPYNAEDESNFKHVRKLILSQNKENKLVPKRRPPSVVRPRTTSYSRVAQTSVSSKVPQVTAPLKSSLKPLSSSKNYKLNKFEYQLHQADVLMKLNNRTLSPSKQRDMSPIHNPDGMVSHQRQEYAERLVVKHKQGKLSLDAMFHCSTVQVTNLDTDPTKTVSGAGIKTSEWVLKDDRLTELESELLYQDSTRKAEEMLKPPGLRRFISPIAELRCMTHSEIERLKSTLHERYRLGLITPRPVPSVLPKSVTMAEPLTSQQEDELLASPRRAQSRSPPRHKSGDEQSDMEVEGERGRSRRKKRKRSKRQRSPSQPSTGQTIKPRGRSMMDEHHKSKRLKPGSRPQTPSRVPLQNPVNHVLRSDLLTNIIVPEIGDQVTSPLLNFASIEKTPCNAMYSGALVISSNVSVQNNYHVHIMGEVMAGTYALCRPDGVPVALVSITYATGNSLGIFRRIWCQFNPFNYPIYSWLFNMNNKPVQVWYTFCLSKIVYPGEYRLQLLPHTTNALGVNVLITEANQNFGTSQFVNYRK